MNCKQLGKTNLSHWIVLSSGLKGIVIRSDQPLVAGNREFPNLPPGEDLPRDKTRSLPHHRSTNRRNRARRSQDGIGQWVFSEALTDYCKADSGFLPH